MAYTSILILDAKSSLFTVRVALQQRYDVDVYHARDAKSAGELVREVTPDYILINPSRLELGLKVFFSELSETGNPGPVIVVGNEEAEEDIRSLYPNVLGHVPPAYSEQDILPFLQRQRVTQTGKLRSRALAERAALVQANQMLERRVQEVVALYKIGKAVASLTDLDAILLRIVEAGVYLLRAEEGWIMLVDRDTNELYLRAQKGMGEKQAKGFNVKIQDTLIGSVVRTGEPIRMARGTTSSDSLKVVTGYLVNALLYVPLALRGQVIGVLGVANQSSPQAFTDHDERLMNALADYAALAIEVAHQHKTLEQMRQELAVSFTIAATVEELRECLATEDPAVLSALRRLEGAVHILTRMAESEAPLDV
jgi:putative methionine-R-sulfoxide reductase with GAF domain